MSQNLLTKIGTPEERLQMGLLALQQKKGILVVDDEDRENEGDLIFSATSLTTEQMALMIRECSGIVCLCITQDKARALGLKPMVETNTSTYGTAFTVTIEAAKGVTTGVSASDRVTTIRAAISDNAGPQDIHCPGHVFPLLARAGGVLERPGHTEATIDLMKLAGLPPYGVLCELTNIDGTMAKLPEIIEFAKKHDYPVLTVQDIIQHLKQK